MITFVKKIVNNFCKRKYLRYINQKNCDLLILDDIYPQQISAFRIIEYASYLDFFNAKVLSTGSAFPLVKEYRSFNIVLSEYYEKYPTHRNKVFYYNDKLKIKAKLIYFIFLNNGIFFLNFIEKSKTPFVFTLYPGGGLRLYDPKVDQLLRRLFQSPFFKKVIVTQKPVLEYLRQSKLLEDENKIEFILGSPAKLCNNKDLLNKKKYFSINKEYLDICFVAGKYSFKGKDKGYDTFIDIIEILNEKKLNIRYHVVGGFDKNDIDVSKIGNNIKFYGFLETDLLHEFFINMDIILSPNISNVLHKGSFDGFPLGCVLEAAGCGVLMIVYDDLKQNVIFENGKNIIIAKNKTEMIDKIIFFYNNTNQMYAIARRGRSEAINLSSFEKQIKPRIDLIRREIYDKEYISN